MATFESAVDNLADKLSQGLLRRGSWPRLIRTPIRKPEVPCTYTAGTWPKKIV